MRDMVVYGHVGKLWRGENRDMSDHIIVCERIVFAMTICD